MAKNMWFIHTVKCYQPLKRRQKKEKKKRCSTKLKRPVTKDTAVCECTRESCKHRDRVESGLGSGNKELVCMGASLEVCVAITDGLW